MKNKLILFLTTFILLTGCNNKNNSSNNSSASSEPSSSSSQSSSEPDPEPTEFGYDYYDGYYGELKWTNGADLKQKLHDIIRDGWQPLTYTAPNWESNSEADKSMYDYEYVDVLYNGENIKKSLTNIKWQRPLSF